MIQRVTRPVHPAPAAWKHFDQPERISLQLVRNLRAPLLVESSAGTVSHACASPKVISNVPLKAQAPLTVRVCPGTEPQLCRTRTRPRWRSRPSSDSWRVDPRASPWSLVSKAVGSGARRTDDYRESHPVGDERMLSASIRGPARVSLTAALAACAGASAERESTKRLTTAVRFGGGLALAEMSPGGPSASSSTIGHRSLSRAQRGYPPTRWTFEKPRIC